MRAATDCGKSWGEVEIQSWDENGADFEVTGDRLLFRQLALEMEQGVGTMGLRQGLVLWPLCGLQYYHTKRKVVL